MREELASILDDPAFAKSPVTARLLTYLVDHAATGDGRSLKSYTVAVDGLGRSPDFDSQIDTYARVQVGRLRKSLEAFYAGSGAGHEHQFLIDRGAYGIRLVTKQPPAVPQPLPRRARPASRWRRAFGIGAIAVAVVAIALATLWWRATAEDATRRWRSPDFPMVDVVVTSEARNETTRNLAAQIRQSILSSIDDYETVRPVYTPGAKGKYSIDVRIVTAPAGYRQQISLVDRAADRIIWSKAGNLAYRSGDVDLSADKLLSDSVFYVVSITGAIHSYEGRSNYDTHTPYGCWRRFMAGLQVGNTIGDGVLAQCAEDWYGAAPNHPLAAALRGWTLLDQSLSKPTETSRQATLAEALGVLEQAKELNPNSPFLRLASMRAYALTGNLPAMRAAASAAIRLNPDNLDILGATGLYLALWNDPQGELLLDKALVQHFNPPNWCYIGGFVSAMMRQDTQGAGRALAQLKALQHSLPILPVLSAALEARTGRLDEARASWEGAKANYPVIRLSPDHFLERMPIGPTVRVRLKEWLAPLIVR